MAYSNAQVAAYAVEAAGLQGKYWQMHAKLFESQNEWSNSDNPKNIFDGYATSLGIDMAKFNSDINSKTVNDKIQSDTSENSRLGGIRAYSCTFLSFLATKS